MKKSLVRLMTAVLVLSLFGCGRNASVVGTSSGHRPAKCAPEVGDCAEYSIVSNTLIGKTSIKGGGRRKCSVVRSSNHSRSVPSYIVRTFDIREDTDVEAGPMGKSRTVLSWYGLDASNNLYILGEAEDGVTWEVFTDANPPMIMPSQLKVGSTWGYEAHFASGTTESVNMNCVGTERLTTAAGTFEAYKISYNITRKGTSLSGYVWYTPTVPLVFELAVDLNCSPVRGHPGVQMTYELESLNLVK